MKLRVAFLVIFALAGFEAFAQTHTDLRAKAQALDDQARTALGMDVESLALLLEADESSFHPKWALEESGKWQRLEQLHEDGFVILTERSALPNAQGAGESFVNFTLSDRGKAIVSGLRAR